jgi:hypothetical protein
MFIRVRRRVAAPAARDGGVNMKRNVKGLLLATVVLASVFGCADPVDRLVTVPETRAKLLDRIVADNSLATEVVGRLLASPDAQGQLFDQIMQNSDAAQNLMLKLAKNQSMIDGVVNVAVQDPAMKEHLMTLFKGMQMAGGK